MYICTRSMSDNLKNLFVLNLQLHAEAGDLVNATGGYVNAYNGNVTEFSGADDLSPGMKVYYDTELLENMRDVMPYHQLGKTIVLPTKHGMTVEVRKMNTLPDCDVLQEAVIPVGKKLGQTAYQVTIVKYGMFVAVSEEVDLHHVDPILLANAEELSASYARTYEKHIRNVLGGNTNVIFADVTDADNNIVSTPATRTALIAAIKVSGQKANLTSEAVARAQTALVKGNAPKFDGKDYVGVVHPSAAHDLRRDPEWIDYHKYAAMQELFFGEIGSLHGVRFTVSNLAPVIKAEDETHAIYQTMIFGKDAFCKIDPQGAGMRMIYKTAAQVGGPLEQFGTQGVKGSMAARMLYPERMVIIEHGSSRYSTVDTAN